MNKRFFLALVIIIPLGAALVTYHAVQKGSTRSGVTQKVKVAQVGEFFLYMPLYYAAEKGFFGKHGLELEIVNSGGDEKSVAAVISGDVTFGVGDPTFSPIAGQRGVKTRIIAAVLNRMPFWGVTFKAAIPVIDDPKQLNGYSVATFPSPSTAYTVQSEMFKEAGLEPNIRQVQFGALLPALKSGAADIALEIEPNVSIASNEGARVLYSFAKRYGDFSVTGVSVLQATIEKKPELVRAFVKALNEAEIFAHANPADVEEFAVKRFPSLDPAVARAAIRRMLQENAFPPTAKISEAAWRKAIELRVQSKEIQSLQEAMAYLDMTFADQ